MLQQLVNCFKVKASNDIMQSYEKDVLSSMKDVLPSFKSENCAIHNEKIDSIQNLNRQQTINSPQDQQQKFNSSFSNVQENDEDENQYCKYSLDYFTMKNKIRIICVHCYESKLFQFSVLTFAMIQSLILLVKPTNQISSGVGININENVTNGFGYAADAIYCIHGIVSMIAIGIWNTKFGYYKDIVAIINLICMFFTLFFQMFYLYIFRIMMIVQLLQHQKLFRITLHLSQTIKYQLMPLFYIFLIILYFLTVFSIIGLQVWHKQLDNYCLNSLNQLDSEPARLCNNDFGRTCQEGYICSSIIQPQSYQQLAQHYISFDDLPKSMITMFAVQQVEGYVEIEQVLSDSVNKYLASFFLWIYIILSSFFLTNLIVAVLLQKFKVETIDEPHPIFASQTKLNTYPPERRKTLFLGRGIVSSSRRRAMQLLAYKNNVVEKTRMRSLCKKIIGSKYTKYGYSLLFLTNLIVFSFNNESAFYDHFEDIIAKINLTLICIYLFEDTLKLYVWKQKENKTILILESVIDFICLIFQSLDMNVPFVWNSLKGLRLLWFFSTQTNWSNYRVLLSALYKSFITAPSLILIIFVYAAIAGVIGRELFGGKLRFNSDSTYSIDGTVVPRINFDSLRDMFSSMSIIICSDQWQTLFYQSLETGSWLAYPYYIIVLLVAKLLILPSFLTVMLNNYEEAKQDAEKQRFKAEKVINQMRKTTRAQVTPMVNQSYTPQDKKKYFGRSSQLSDDSIEENQNTAIQGVNTGFHRSASRIPQQANIPLNNMLPQQDFKEQLKNSSYYIFHNRGTIRRKITQLIQIKYYEWFVSVLIVLNMILLGFDIPLREENIVIDNINILITVLFTIDMLLKSISAGFIININDNSKAYMRNKQNFLDFIILVITSINDYGVYRSGYLRSFKSLRCLRILVSIRRGSQNEKINLIAGSLFQTISLLSSMLFVSGISIWILSIFCMSFWKGKLYFCAGVDQYIDQIFTQSDCLSYGGNWINNITNFDTIQDSLVSLFRLIIGEGWVQLMFAVSDISGRGLHPKPNASGAYQILFYLLLFVLNIMLLNLFYGLIINNYRTIKENIENFKNLNKNQRQWVEMSTIMQKKNLITLVIKPNNKIMEFCYKLASFQYFEAIIAILLMINLIFCAAISGNENQSTQTTFYTINILFIVLFHIEVIVKLLAFWMLYIKDAWNKLDMLLLLVTDILVILESQNIFPKLMMIPLILRSFRIVNIQKMIRINRHLKVLVDVIYDALPTLISAMALIMITTIMYALIGVQILSTVKSTTSDPQYPYYKEYSTRTLTFTSFYESLLILIEISTGQFWTLYLTNYAIDKEGCHSQTYQESLIEGVQGCSTFVAYIYFISFLILIRIIMMSLFLAMIIESYSDCILENTAIISPSQIEDFLLKWSDYDPQGTGWIQADDFAFLMFEMNHPLGFKDENSQYYEYNPNHKASKANIVNHKKKMILQRKDILKNLRNFNVPIYINKKIHFKDVCIQIAHNAVCFKNSILAIEQIDDKVVMRKIRKSWENRYPDLADYSIDKKIGFAVDIFAVQSIKKIWKDAKEQKKIKRITKENQIQNKLKLLAQNEVSYLTKQNGEEGIRHRKKSMIKKRVFHFSQVQRNNRLGGEMDFQNVRRQDRKTQQWEQNPEITSAKLDQRKNSLQTHNFYIEPSELYNGFPMKVVYETQKIDFPSHSPQDSNFGSQNQLINTGEQLSNSLRLKEGISEKGSDEEDQQDSIIYQIKDFPDE